MHEHGLYIAKCRIAEAIPSTSLPLHTQRSNSGSFLRFQRFLSAYFSICKVTSERKR
jgi:hypothetical protein